MAQLKVDAEPEEVGFDPGRLQRIDAHFRRYVDDGRLAGWTIAVTRRGRVAHLSHHGLRRRRGRPPGRRRHPVAHLLDDQAGHLGRRADALRAGRARAHRPGLALHPVVRRHAGLRRGLGGATRAPCPPSSRCGSGTCSPTPPGSPTASTTRTRSTRSTGRKGFEFGVPRGMDLAAACDAWAGHAAGVPARRASGTTPWPPTCSAASSRWCPGRRLDAFFAEHILGPLGMTDTAFWVGRTTSTGSPRSTSPDPRGRACAATSGWATPPPARRRSSPAAAAWSPPRPTTTGSPRCCCAAASSTAPGCSDRAPSPT